LGEGSQKAQLFVARLQSRVTGTYLQDAITFVPRWRRGHGAVRRRDWTGGASDVV